MHTPALRGLNRAQSREPVVEGPPSISIDPPLHKTTLMIQLYNYKNRIGFHLLSLFMLTATRVGVVEAGADPGFFKRRGSILGLQAKKERGGQERSNFGPNVKKPT